MNTDSSLKKIVDEKRNIMSEYLKFYTDYLEKKGVKILSSNSYSMLVSRLSGILEYIYSDNIEMLCNELLLSEDDKNIIKEDIISYHDYETVCMRILINSNILVLLNSKNINKNGKDIIKKLFIYNFYYYGPLTIYEKTKSEITFAYGNITPELNKLCDETINSLETYKNQINLFKKLSYSLENETFSENDLKEKVKKFSKELKLNY